MRLPTCCAHACLQIGVLTSRHPSIQFAQALTRHDIVFCILQKHPWKQTICLSHCFPTTFCGMPTTLCMFWLQYSLGCHDSKHGGVLFVDATFRKMNASHELSPPVSFMLSAPTFAHWMVFVCFVWAVALTIRGQQTLFVSMRWADAASCFMLRCLQVTQRCNTSNICEKWCPRSLSPGQLRYPVQCNLIIRLEQRTGMWNQNSNSTFTVGHSKQ